MKAAACGTVSFAARQSGYGNMVCVQHTTTFSTCYAHLKDLIVAVGTPVAAGTVIGHVGMTGRTTGAHLHFETRIDGVAHNPAPYLAGTKVIPGTARRPPHPLPERRPPPPRRRRRPAARRPPSRRADCGSLTTTPCASVTMSGCTLMSR